MRRPLLPAFAILGGVQGWLLLNGYNGAFDCSSRRLSACAREWLTSVALFALAAATVAALLARAPRPTTTRFVGIFLASTYVTLCVPMLFTSPLGWNADVLLSLVLVPFSVALFSLPFFALPFFVWRAPHARPNSLLGRVEARGLWIALTVAIATATSLATRTRGWLFNDKVRRLGPPDIGVRVELAVELLALVAMAPLVARDVGDAVRVSRIDLAALTRASDHALEIIDLGVGESAHIEVLESGATYRDRAVGLAVKGDVERTRRRLRRRVWLDAIAVTVGVGALYAFQAGAH